MFNDGERACSIHSEGNLSIGGFQRQAWDKRIFRNAPFGKASGFSFLNVPLRTLTQRKPFDYAKQPVPLEWTPQSLENGLPIGVVSRLTLV